MFGNTFFKIGTRSFFLYPSLEVLAVPAPLANQQAFILEKIWMTIGCENFFKKIISHLIEFKLEIGNWKLEIC